MVKEEVTDVDTMQERKETVGKEHPLMEGKKHLLQNQAWDFVQISPELHHFSEAGGNDT